MSQIPTNQLGLTKAEYQGAPSTLCTGCGHDSITGAIVNALYRANVNPYKVAKVSGIGCSSKTTNYFLNFSHGFNSLHGRMAPLATGTRVANRNLLTLGVSGDGDTASIGLGGFAHLIRRNLPMVYIVENNGVYGLTKGQFSATADRDSSSKSGEMNPFSTIDICTLALDLGCGFVARSFSGDQKQLGSLIEAAFSYPGTALIDVISPCVTFANHDGSTKSYNYVKEHISPLHDIDVIYPSAEISIDYSKGSTKEILLPDGKVLRLEKLEDNFNPTNKLESFSRLLKSRESGEILTGLFFLDENKQTLEETLNLSQTPLCQLSEAELVPSEEDLKNILKAFS